MGDSEHLDEEFRQSRLEVALGVMQCIKSVEEKKNTETEGPVKKP